MWIVCQQTILVKYQGLFSQKKIEDEYHKKLSQLVYMLKRVFYLGLLW